MRRSTKRKISLSVFMVLVGLSFYIASCQKKNTSSSGASCGLPAVASCGTGANVLPITIGPQSVCGQGGYVNEPCVSVKICVPTTATCVTVDNILLDTGSYGLRVYGTEIAGIVASLPAVTDGSAHPMVECALFGTGAEWGSVKTADVYLGGENAATVSIQVIDKNFASMTGTSCAGQNASPGVSADGFRGILGVGVFPQDCGSGCAVTTNNGFYYNCNTAACPSGTAVSNHTLAVASQVANPVAFMPADNNGVLLRIPDVPPSGAVTQTGCMMLGIGTQSNNSTSGVTMYPADSSGNFKVTFGSTTYNQSFIDSGSNGIFFPSGSSSPPACSSSGSAPGFYCPTSDQSLSATNAGSSGSPSGTACFVASNAENLIQTGNLVFDDLTGSTSGYFDWGLPFFLGRSVFVGIQGKSSGLGTGPYWAY